ncbi:hypothetical protein CEXT_405721 [Caerostris extrusa]|uniref:Uncharacterized protein n=1 Tax=Caerostris extrusa TaxID=172846 RepID=A0AAV4UPJ0_CAEEX|nr:hypothetical protein CEXT_405721 [Caerostris extrusa]
MYRSKSDQTEIQDKGAWFFTTTSLLTHKEDLHTQQTYTSSHTSNTSFLHLVVNSPPPPTYPPDSAPFDCNLFSSKFHSLSMKRFYSYEDVEKWLHDLSKFMKLIKVVHFFRREHPQIAKELVKMCD